MLNQLYIYYMTINHKLTIYLYENCHKIIYVNYIYCYPHIKSVHIHLHAILYISFPLNITSGTDS